MALTDKVKIIVEAEDRASRTLNKIDGSVEDLGDTTKKTSGKLGGIGSALGQVAIAAGVVGGAMLAAKKTFDFAKEGAQLQKTRDTFDALTASINETSGAMLGDLRKATEGMVADTELMEATSRNMSMGLAGSREEAAKLAEIAVTLGGAMGKEATPAMEEFSLMLANMSIPRLDTFGISASAVKTRIKELQEETEGMSRETAFMTAVMEEAETSMIRLGDSVPVDPYTQFEVQTKNLTDELKMMAGSGLAPLVTKLSETVTASMNQEEALQALNKEVAIGTITADELGAAYDNVKDGTNDNSEALQALLDKIAAGKQEWVEYGDRIGVVDQNLANYIATTQTAVTETSNLVGVAGSYFADVLSDENIGVQDNFNMKVFEMANAAGADAEALVGLAGEMGLYADETLKAMAETAIMNATLETLAGKFAAGELSAHEMWLEVLQVRRELENIEGDYEAHLALSVSGLDRMREARSLLDGGTFVDVPLHEQPGNPANRVPDPDARPPAAGPGVPEFAHGGDFIVPGGGPFPMIVHPGERVQVTPASQVNNFNMTVNTSAQSSSVISDFRLMQAEAGR